jgi:hypothetical protein
MSKSSWQRLLINLFSLIIVQMDLIPFGFIVFSLSFLLFLEYR